MNFSVKLCADFLFENKFSFVFCRTDRNETAKLSDDLQSYGIPLYTCSKHLYHSSKHVHLQFIRINLRCSKNAAFLEACGFKCREEKKQGKQTRSLMDHHMKLCNDVNSGHILQAEHFNLGAIQTERSHLNRINAKLSFHIFARINV